MAIDEEGNPIGQGSIWKQYNMFFAFGAQFAYVGAQVTIGAFFINYVVENGGYSKPQASNFLSYALIIFTVGRFFAVAIAFILAPSFIMCVYSLLAIALTAAASGVKGSPAVGVLMVVYFLMAPMYPTIFTLGTASKSTPESCFPRILTWASDLGTHTRRGAGILVMVRIT
jgi:FHS family L-fucose permease-like MFS transporter